MPDWKQAAQPQGAVHPDELPFVFDTPRLSARLGPKTTATDLAVATEMHSCWVAFAKMAPDLRTIRCGGGFDWPAHTAANDAVAVFDRTPSLAAAAPIVARQQAQFAAPAAKP